MKKIIILFAMFIGMAVASRANEVSIIDRFNNDVTKIANIKPLDKRYDFVTNHKQLGDFLGLSKNDSINNLNVYHVYDVFCDGMHRAGMAEDENVRTNLVVNSIDYAVRNMRVYLDDYQYHMFLRGLNVTLMNRGFHKEIYEYCEKTNK